MKQMKPTFQFVSRVLDTHFNSPTCMKDEKEGYMQEEQPAQADADILEELTKTFQEVELGKMEILNKIK